MRSSRVINRSTSFMAAVLLVRIGRPDKSKSRFRLRWSARTRDGLLRCELCYLDGEVKTKANHLAIDRPPRAARATFIAGLLLFLTGCETTRNLFLQPSPDWQAKSGQLQYRGPKTSLIGEVLVRFSKQGDFELTFTKGPGITLMMIRQNASVVRATGPLARGSWSGPTESAPKRLRGWLELRDFLLRSGDQTSLQYVAGTEKFTFRF